MLLEVVVGISRARPPLLLRLPVQLLAHVHERGDLHPDELPQRAVREDPLEGGGADALVVANALLGMAIDATTFRPKLGNLMGGLTGPATKPVILRMVYQCARAVSTPIIGCGGIATVADVVEYMLAGATAIQVGTANFIHPDAMIHIIDGLPEFCEQQGLERVADLTGALILGNEDRPARDAAI